MTLSHKVALKLVVMTGGVIALGAVALIGLWRMHENLGEALGQYGRLEAVYDLGSPLLAAREALRAEPPNVAVARESLRRVADRLSGGVGGGSGEAPTELSRAVWRAADRLEAMAPGAGRAAADAGLEVDGALVDVNLSIKAASRLAEQTRRSIRQVQRDARARLAWATTTTATLAAVVLAGAIALSVWQHRGVIGPLRRVQRGVRRIADGRFDERLDARGRDELGALAADFNGMVERLESLYRDLESQVREKSRELVRSERLASVGHLAAGVAHEINNPLGIIAAHAELAIRRLEREREAGAPGAASSETIETMRVIHDEAFRGKRIVEKLLILSRGGDEHRDRLSLAGVARQVAQSVRELPRYRGREIEVDCDEAQPLDVIADETQVKQVVLNLLVNALAATRDGGRVRLGGGRRGATVRLFVEDDGVGMDATTMEHVFEPFFSTRRGGDGGPDAMAERGTGLGLSISHAIIADHGGVIRAESEGPGHGSRFTIELPAAGAAGGGRGGAGGRERREP